MSDAPLRVAIVGAGPSGFYAAAQLLAIDEPQFEVDLLDRLPTPFGLVRAGVAPDHPKIKSVTKAFDKTARNERFRFLGGVELGKDVTREELLRRYHAVLYCIGTATDRKLGIPGEDLVGSYPATEFVGWYNGHPDFCDHEYDLQRAVRIAVIGNGNVAMDVARMIALDHDELRATDVADHALDVLGHAAPQEILVIGRRGPVQAAFTTPELREMGELARADVAVDLEGTDLTVPEDAHKTTRDNVALLQDYAGRERTGKPTTVRFQFLRSPVELVGDDDGRVRAIRLERNALVDGRARGTGEVEEVPVDLVFRSIGYTGFPTDTIPFDEDRGLIRNEGGRVVGDDGAPLVGEYVSGWIKRGPSGVIGTNKKDSQDTVNRLVEDAREGRLLDPAEGPLETGIPWQGWQAIDAAETSAGEPQGRPRVKLTRWEQLHEAAGSQPAGA
jgi:ferredoxin/flavodoxin---NADP+ reductase